MGNIDHLYFHFLTFNDGLLMIFFLAPELAKMKMCRNSPKLYSPHARHTEIAAIACEAKIET